MFTGLIQKNARVVSARAEDGMRRVSIEKPSSWTLALGGSVSIDGICATVVQHSAKRFDVEFMPETLRKTTAGGFKRVAHRVSSRFVCLQSLRALSRFTALLQSTV